MNKLEIIKYLLLEIETEKEKDYYYEQHLLECHEKAKENKTGYWIYRDYNIKPTNKTRIKENYKKIRQLCLDLSKEI